MNAPAATPRHAPPRPTIRTVRITADGLFTLLRAASRNPIRIIDQPIPTDAALAGIRTDPTTGLIELDIVWHNWSPDERDQPLDPAWVERVGSAGVPTDWSEPHTLDKERTR